MKIEISHCYIVYCNYHYCFNRIMIIMTTFQVFVQLDIINSLHAVHKISHPFMGQKKNLVSLREGCLAFKWHGLYSPLSYSVTLGSFSWCLRDTNGGFCWFRTFIWRFQFPQSSVSAAYRNVKCFEMYIRVDVHECVHESTCQQRMFSILMFLILKLIPWSNFRNL